MKKYKKIFLAIILSIKTHAMDDFYNRQNEAKLGQHTLSKDYVITLNQLNEAVKRLNETSEPCIKRLVECGHKLDYIKGFDSIGDIGQYVAYLDRYISSEKAYINRLRHPDPTMGSTAHDAAKLIPLVENMIKNAEAKKELAIAKLPREKIKRLEGAHCLETGHKKIIMSLQSLLLPNDGLQENFLKGSVLYYLNDANVKIRCGIENISAHLHNNSRIYDLLDIHTKGDFFHKTSVLLSEVATCLGSVSQNFQIISEEICKIYTSFGLGKKLHLPNESKRDS